MTKIQITLTSDQGYKPLSTVIQVPSVENYKANKSKFKKEALINICGHRRVDATWLRQYGYIHFKARVYDPVKIAKQNKERYDKIKKERGWA